MSLLRCSHNYRYWTILLVVVRLSLLGSNSILAQEPEEVEFPPLLDSEDIAYFFERDDIDGLHWALTNVFEASERNPNSQQVKHALPQQLVSRGGGSSYTTAYKLRMDLEQAEYLVKQLSLSNEDEQHGNKSNKEWIKFFQDVAIPIYKQVLENIPSLDKLERTHGLYAFREKDRLAGIEAIYNKAIYNPPFEELKDPKTGKPLPVLNPNLDLAKIQRQWMGEDSNHHHPGIVIVDDILNPTALHQIRKLLLEHTVWYQTKMPLQFGGYAGAYIDDGLHDRILLQLSFELHKALPRIMEGHPLKYLWAYKYDSEYTGINLHADEAAVNMNIWLTPDEANLDPTSGGLVVFTAKPPDDWQFADYNTNTERVVEELLKPTNFANVTVPHKQNRAILFDSALFHQTDKYHFKPGYENRRINLTLLYGNMKRAATGATSKDNTSTKKSSQTSEL